MSLYPSAPDVFVDRTGAHNIASSDPNNAYDAIENIQNFIGASGEVQSKSATLLNLFRAMLNPMPACSYIDADTIGVDPTQVALFSGADVVIKRNTAVSTCLLSADLLNGSEAATTWYDLYILGDGSNTNFTLGFLGQGTSAAAYATYYQKINAFYNDGSSDILNFYQRGKIMMLDVPISVSTTPSQGAWTGAISCSLAMPLISEMALFGGHGQRSSESSLGWGIRPNGSIWSSDLESFAQGWREISAQRWCATDEAQQIQCHTQDCDTAFRLKVEGYIINI